jgi:hypothetical protein
LDSDVDARADETTVSIVTGIGMPSFD